MRLIEELAFPLAHDLKLVALQGDCCLREDVTPAGGRYVVDDANRAREACLSLVDRARMAHAHLALIPELVIPYQAVAELIGRIASNPEWTERRLVPLAPRTLKRLEAITEGVRARSGVSVEPMQLAALLLEKTTEQLNEDEVKDLVTVRRRASR